VEAGRLRGRRVFWVSRDAERGVEHTDAYRDLVREAIASSAFDLDHLAKLGYVEPDELARLRAAGLRDVADLLDEDDARRDRRAPVGGDVAAVIKRILDAIWKIPRDPADARTPSP
jgi:hypothetical protein